MSSEVMFAVIVIILLIVFAIYMKVTTIKCTCKVQLVGKTVIVTGANTGIGFEAAKDFARRGARVILACRDLKKAALARDNIIQETSNIQVICKYLDLASLQSVRQFAIDILATEQRVNVLVNNAGVGRLGNKKSEDGLQLTIQINHFGSFLLTNLLLGRLRESAPSRIIMVSSVFHKFSKIDLEDLNMFGKWDNILTDILYYNNSKLMNIVTVNELTSKLVGTGVTANSLHPGVLSTGIWRSVPSPLKELIHAILYSFGKTVVDGAQTTIHLAVSPDLENVSGKYFVECKPATADAKANDPIFAKKIWELSEKFVKLQNNEVHFNR